MLYGIEMFHSPGHKHTNIEMLPPVALETRLHKPQTASVRQTGGYPTALPPGSTWPVQPSITGLDAKALYFPVQRWTGNPQREGGFAYVSVMLHQRVLYVQNFGVFQ